VTNVYIKQYNAEEEYFPIHITSDQIGKSVDTIFKLSKSEARQFKQNYLNNFISAELAVSAEVSRPSVIKSITLIDQSNAQRYPLGYQTYQLKTRYELYFPTRYIPLKKDLFFDANKKMLKQGSRLLLSTSNAAEGFDNAVAFSPNGKLVLSFYRNRNIQEDSIVYLWDVNSGYLVRTLKAKNIYSATFSADGRRIIAVSYGKTVIWEVDSGRLLNTIEYKDFITGYGIYSIDFSKNRQKVLLGFYSYWNGIARLWDVESGSLLNTMRPTSGENIKLKFAALSPDGKQVLLAFDNKILKIVEANSGRLIRTWKTKNNVHSLTFSPNGQKVLSTYFKGSGHDALLQLWDVKKGRLLHNWTGHKNRITSVAFSPNGQLALSVSKNDAVKLWEVDSGHLLYTWNNTDYNAFGGEINFKDL